MSLISNFFNVVITYPIFNVLMLLYHLFGDFGLSIIVLTIAITALLLPLTLRQLQSMKATLALQPELAEIRRRHAQDLKAQHEATQELYKQHGISPASSFLGAVRRKMRRAPSCSRTCSRRATSPAPGTTSRRSPTRRRRPGSCSSGSRPSS